MTSVTSEKKRTGVFINNVKEKSVRKHQLKKWLIAFGIILAVLFLLFIYYYPSGKEVYRSALSGKDDFLKAQGAIGAQDFSGAKKALGTANEKFSKAKTEFGKFRIFKFIPLIGHQVSAVENILIAGIQLSSGFQELADVGETIFSPLKKDGSASLAEISPEETRLILEKIYESPPQLQGVKAEIDLAVQAISEISQKGLLGPIKNTVEQLKEQLPPISDSLELAIPAAEALPQIVGYPQEKTYLFLLQNNTEMRPTGGFIGTYGILKLKDGSITLFTTDNIYNLDNKVKDVLIETPPWPLQKYLNATKWFMRDSNWSPDFPIAAQKAEWFYHQEGGGEENFNGVIAVTPTFIQSLLGLTGEIEVNGIKFNSDNFVDTLQYQVEQGFYRQGISDAERKEVIGVLASKLLDEILSLPSEKWPDLWKTFQADIKAKRILIYLKDENLENLILEEGWGGEIKTTTSDYFAVFDANMASLKSDPGVIRTISYTLTQNEAGELIAKLNIHYDNQGTFNWKSTRYRTYTRVYVPQGSKLIESQGAMENDKLHGGRPGEVEVIDEYGKTCFGAFISIEPQTQGDLSFTYQLPTYIAEQVRNKSYALYAQKQAGTPAYQFNLVLEFNDKISSFSSIDKAAQEEQNKIILNTDLLEDREFSLSFK
ncbi:MAG: hypothetical protein COT24_05260 [Candidatus Kerfeldbacteria bacterium CG08_land_8_20_14_0_20_40_16]|uniref:DUF4012 domain-containing protein n=1 Tax=Candidatus Kerfeldbacteria bacterium CG08_land_8_20_14_0_20_40_16 TaxID=2014244 RepID=A0A2H0YUK2_9BACT|nr:MAG: hypothetical protein COT24_05260 [Candidatus Kerfeldbacteria bacterium CG08_land_8_20_14_0_20_40_16]